MSNQHHRSNYYGKAPQEIGRETDGGTLVTTISDSHLKVLIACAWDTNAIHDLQVLELERDSRK